MSDMSNTQDLQHWLERLQTGEPEARHRLAQCAFERLQRLARKMLRDYPRVKRWEETDDVLQNALIRLDRALQDVCPATVLDYFRLAALQMRRELLDLARSYYGPQGLGANHESHSGEASSEASRLPEEGAAPSSLDPAHLAVWTEFHTQVKALPEDQQAIFDLLWYQGLTQAEASVLLNVPERTLKRRWQQLRLKLNKLLLDPS